MSCANKNQKLCMPSAGNGTGGESIWGGEFPDEISRWAVGGCWKQVFVFLIKRVHLGRRVPG